MIRKLLELRRHRFVRDTIILQASAAVQAGTYFVTSVLTQRYLGMVDLGRWNASRSIFTIAYFFVSAGVVNATVSRYSEAIGRQNRRDATHVLASMLKIGIVSSSCVLLLGFLLGPWVGERFYGDREIGQWAALLCVAGVFEVIRGLTVAALMGTRQMREFAWFDMTSNVLRVAIVWTALLLHTGVAGVVVAYLVHMLVGGVIALRYYARARDGHAKLAPPPLRDVLAAVKSARMSLVFGTSYLIALNKSMNVLLPLAGMLLIPAVGAVRASADEQSRRFAANGHFGIAYAMSWGLGLAMTGVAQTLLPTLGLKLGSSDVSFDKMGGLLRRVALMAGLFMVAATIVSVPIGYLAIRYAYGPDAIGSFPYFLWLMSGNLFLGFSVVIDPFYLYSRRLRFAVLLNFVLAGLALAGMVFGRAWYGPIGVAAAAGLSDGLALFHLVYIWIYFHRARARRATAPDNQGHSP